MAEVQIKHAQFQYWVEVDAVDPESGETKKRLAPRIARRDEIVDIPRNEDVERGEQMGAFYTEEDFDQAEEEESSSDEEAEPSRVPSSEGEYDKLVAWIRDERPNATTVVQAAGGDPEKARMLIEAENEASGGDPRKTVIDPLTKIAQS